MPRKPWMYTGDIKGGMSYDLRPGVERDRNASPDELVWRYMPLSRFEEAIRGGTLFFTRLSHYARHGDPLEGSTPRPFTELRKEALRDRGVDIDQYNRDAETLYQQMLQTVLVNCWHKREYESELMWDRYGQQQDAVAIVSTLDRLIDAMPDEATVGHVDYIDFATDGSFSSNPVTRAFMKKRTLEDEREVRAVVYEPPVTANGRWSISIRPGEEIGHTMPVKMETLITRVVLSPLSSGCREKASLALAQAGLSVPIVDSELVQPPRY